MITYDSVAYFFYSYLYYYFESLLIFR